MIDPRYSEYPLKAALSLLIVFVIVIVIVASAYALYDKYLSCEGVKAQYENKESKTPGFDYIKRLHISQACEES